MQTHTVEVVGVGVIEASEGVKLVHAIERGGVDISHRCGGLARCTTCRVVFFGEEPPMGEVERASLEEDGVLGQFRLSCQVRVDRPMKVEVLMRASVKGWDPGPEVED